MVGRSCLRVKGVVKASTCTRMTGQTPDIGDRSHCGIEKENNFDRYAVAVIVKANMVEHTP